MNSCISSRQLCAGVFTAMCVPIFMLCARLPWQWVLFASCAAGILYYIIYRLLQELRGDLAQLLVRAFGTVAGKTLCILTSLVALLLAGIAAAHSGSAFPETDGSLTVGVLVLLLAAIVSYAGLSAALRCGSILFLATAVVFGAILLFSAPEIRYALTLPEETEQLPAASLLLLLLPLLALCFRDEITQINTRIGYWLLAGALTAIAAPIVTTGCLSAPLAAQRGSFYTLAGSVSVFGIMERSEPLLSAAYLLAYFTLCSVLFCAAQKLFRAVLPKLGDFPAQSINLLFSVLALLLLRGVPAWAILAASGAFCGILTLTTLGIARLKKL